MVHTPRSSSPISLHRITTEHTVRDESAQAGSSSAAASELPPGGAPVTPADMQRIERDLERALIPATQTGGTSQVVATQEQRAVPAALALQRTRFEQARDAGGRPLDTLREQFLLEGQAIRTVLGKDEDIARLGSGELTRQAVAGDLTAGLDTLLGRANLYAALNTNADTHIAQPFNAAELAGKGIGASDEERELHRLCLTHEAYGKVLGELHAQREGTPAGAERDELDRKIGDVKLAHEAFKLNIAALECRLEEIQRVWQVRLEMATNKIPFVHTEEGRRSAAARIAPELDRANRALAFCGMASNEILYPEHAADHRRRALTSDDGVASAFTKAIKQLYMASVLQGLSSWVTWGYGRGGGALLVEHVLPHIGGVGGVLASAAIQGVALGLSHKAWSDLPREGLQMLAEVGDWARPVEPSNMKQLFPDARRSRLDDDGNPLAGGDGAPGSTQADIDRKRQEFKDQSSAFGFGNVYGNFIGQSAFAVSNAVGDRAASAGFEGADSIHGRSIRSLVGGTGMTFGHEIGKLRHQVHDQPTHVTAKRQNPRGVVQRLVTAAQKLDLTQPANRLDGWSRIMSAFVGIVGAEALDRLGSEPLQKILDKAEDGNVPQGAAAGHAVLEGFKSYPTLDGFFSHFPVAKELDSVPGQMSSNTKRMLIGPHNLFDPTRKASTSAYPKGSMAYYCQVVDNVGKGGAQLVAQPLAVAAENTTMGVIGLPSRARSAWNNRGSNAGQGDTEAQRG